ncbi:hypothetical protein FRC04_000003 [Tulasnella sp. 424]|nr:hypothetical protein FRC04_000003 [Tulasnella sp. 424]
MTTDSPSKDGLQGKIGDTDLESTEAAKPSTTTAAMAGPVVHLHQDRPRQETGIEDETVHQEDHRQIGETVTVTIELGLHPHGTTPEAHLRIHGIEAGGMNGREIGTETETGTETGIETGIEGGGTMTIMIPHLDALTVHHREEVEMIVIATVDLVHHLRDVHLRQDIVARLPRDPIAVVRREALHDTLADLHLVREQGVHLHGDVARRRMLQVRIVFVPIQGVRAGVTGREASGAPPPTSSSKAEASSPAKEEPIQVKEEPFDGPMDLDRAALPSTFVKRERSASPVKAQTSSPERNHEASSSSGAGPSSERPPTLQQGHERRLPPTGPRGARTREGERSPSRSVKAESPALPSVHKLKQEPSPYHRQNEGSMSPAVTSPHPNHHHIPTGPSNRTGKPIPSGPRAANRTAAPPFHAALVKTEPEKPKVKDIEIPNRRRDWSYLPGQKEVPTLHHSVSTAGRLTVLGRSFKRELLSQKLLAQQKALQDLALEVIRSGWDLDVHAVELEGLKEKREVAEKMFERASQGLTQDEAVDQNPAAQLKPPRSGSAAPSKAPSAGPTN